MYPKLDPLSTIPSAAQSLATPGGLHASRRKHTQDDPLQLSGPADSTGQLRRPKAGHLNASIRLEMSLFLTSEAQALLDSLQRPRPSNVFQMDCRRPCHAAGITAGWVTWDCAGQSAMKVYRATQDEGRVDIRRYP